MKKFLTLVTALCVLGCILPPDADAKSFDAKSKDKQVRKMKMLEQRDVDGKKNKHFKRGGVDNMREQWSSMTAEEKKEFLKKRRETFSNMSPEERKAYFKKKHEKWSKISPEERKKLAHRRRDKMQNLSPAQKK